MRKSLFVLLIYLFLIPKSFGQNNVVGSWNILNLRYSLSDSLTFFGEAQLRSLGFYNDFHYHEWKVGVLYQLEKNCNVGFGFGKYDTYQAGGDFITPKRSDEWRLWPQVIMKQKIYKLGIEHRYRAEFRWFPNGFRFRARYKLSVNYKFQLFKKLDPIKLEAGTEIFFGNKSPYFERNRMNISTTIPINKVYSMYLGYLHQFDYQINDETGRDFIQVGFFFKI